MAVVLGVLLLQALRGVPFLSRFLAPPQPAHTMSTQASQFLIIPPKTDFRLLRVVKLMNVRAAFFRQKNTPQIFMLADGLEPPLLDKLFEHGLRPAVVEPLVQQVAHWTDPSVQEDQVAVESLKVLETGTLHANDGVGPIPVPFKRVQILLRIEGRKSPVLYEGVLGRYGGPGGSGAALLSYGPQGQYQAQRVERFLEAVVPRSVRQSADKL